MDSRKLQLVGGGASFSISLPKQWVESRGLKAGDEVVIEPRSDGGLSLRAPGNGTAPLANRVVAIRSSDPDEVLRSLIALYVAGFGTAVVEHRDADPLAVRTGVGEACARLHGVQVVEETPNRLVLQDLSDTSDFNFNKGLRRMQALVVQMLTNVGRLVGGGGDAVYRETERYEAELDRIVLLLLKQYTTCLKRGEFPPAALASAPEGLHGMFVAQFLERIGDYAMRVSQYSHFLAQDPAPPVAEAVGSSIDTLRGIVGDAIQAFNQRDVPLANAVIKRALAFAPTTGRDGLFDVFTSPRSKPQLYSCVRCIKFFNLLESIERIALYAKSIAETAINAAMVEASPDRR